MTFTINPMKSVIIALLLLRTLLSNEGIASQTEDIETSKLFGTAENGSEKDFFKLSEIYADATSEHFDSSKSCLMLTKAAENGYIPAFGAIGEELEYGNICQIDIPLAMFWYKKAGEHGDINSLFNLAYLYLRDDHENSDVQKGIALFQYLADEGYLLAIHELAVMYEFGKFLPRDTDKAEELYLIGAADGFSVSQRNLGLLYLTRSSDEKDRNEGFAWLMLAVAQGDRYAQSEAGSLLIHGDLVEQDLEKGKELLTKSANSGSIYAQRLLGDFYFFSFFNNINHDLSLFWYKKAATQGDTESIYQIGTLYGYTDLDWQNWDEAKKWFEIGANQNDVKSISQLLLLSSISGNIEEVKKYIKQALELTSPDSIERLEFLSSNWLFLIEFYISQNSPDKAQDIYEQFKRLSSIFSQKRSEAYESEHFYHKYVGDYLSAEKSLIDAIAFAEDEGERSGYKKQLEWFLSQDEIPIGHKIPSLSSHAIELDKLTTLFHKDFDEVILKQVVLNVENPKISSRADALVYMQALRSLVDYFDFEGKYEDSAKYATLYLNSMERDHFSGLNYALKLKMQSIAAYPDSYDVAEEKLLAFSKENILNIAVEDSAEIEFYVLNTSLNLKYNNLDLAKKSFETAFQLYAENIETNGRCFSNFRFHPRIYFSFNDTYLIKNLSNKFITSVKSALKKFGSDYLETTCGEHIAQFSGLILKFIERHGGATQDATLIDFLITARVLKQSSSREKASLKSLFELNIDNDIDKNIFNEYSRVLNQYDTLLVKQSHQIESEIDVKAFSRKVEEVFKQVKELELKLNESGALNILRSRVQLVDINTLRNSLKDNEVLLSLLSYENSLYVMIISNKKAYLSSANIETEKLITLAEQVRASISQSDVLSPLDIAPFAFDEALKIYQSTFKIIAPYMKEAEKIYVIENSDVLSLPLSILPTEQLLHTVKSSLDFSSYRTTKWFAQNKQLIYVSSLSLFNGDSSIKNFDDINYPVVGITPYSSLVSEPVNNFLIGVKQFLFQGQVSDESITKLPELPSTVEQIKNLLGNTSQQTVLAGEKATTSATINVLESKTAKTVIFSTHTYNSGLLVRSDTNSDRDFAVLAPENIVNLKINTEWIVLLACNTGDISDSNRTYGLADSFIHAGARRVLISDWDVEANATTKLTELISLEPKEHEFGKRLSAAQLRLRNESSAIIYAHPMFWGAFRIIGYP